MGEHAVKRYWQIRLGHILPHEQMLCKEARWIGQQLAHGAQLTKPQRIAITTFLRYIAYLDLSRRTLQQSGLCSIVVDTPFEDSCCMRCGRKCFLCHVHVPNDSEKYLCLKCAKCVESQRLPEFDEWVGFGLRGWQIETRRYAREFRKLAKILHKMVARPSGYRAVDELCS